MRENCAISVSVIIPTYNRREKVKNAIVSVLAQKFKNFELIVVDDGSTDGTNPSDWPKDVRIQFMQQTNKGVSSARNKGVLHAKGNLIAFLDSDDEWLPWKLTKQVQFFEENPTVLICQTQEVWIRNGRRVNPKHKHQKKSGDIFKDSLALCLVSPSAVMMRKELFDNVGLFDSALWACEDYDLWLRVACRYPIYLVDEPFVIKNGGYDDQLSQKPCLDALRIYSLQKLLYETPLTEDQRNQTIMTLIEKCRIYALGCKKHGKLEESARIQQIAREWELK